MKRIYTAPGETAILVHIPQEMQQTIQSLRDGVALMSSRASSVIVEKDLHPVTDDPDVSDFKVRITSEKSDQDPTISFGFYSAVLTGEGPKEWLSVVDCTSLEELPDVVIDEKLVDLLDETGRARRVDTFWDILRPEDQELLVEQYRTCNENEIRYFENGSEAYRQDMRTAVEEAKQRVTFCDEILSGSRTIQDLKQFLGRREYPPGPEGQYHTPAGGRGWRK